MLDLLTIFTRGGAVLWSKATSTSIPESAVDSLVQNVLLEERAGQTSYKYENYTFKWTFQNDLDLVFVAVYFHLSQFLNIDDLLDTVKREFVSIFRDDIRRVPRPKHFVKFDAKFTEIIDNVENTAADRRPNKPRSFADTKKGKEQRVGEDDAANPPSTKSSKGAQTPKDFGAELPQSKPSKIDVKATESAAVETPKSSEAASPAPTPKQQVSSPNATPTARGVSAAQMAKIQKEQMALSKGGPSKKAAAAAKPKEPTEKKKYTKVMAQSNKSKKDETANLDYSIQSPSSGANPEPIESSFGPAPEEGEKYIDGENDQSDDEEVKEEPEEDDEEEVSPTAADAKSGKPAKKSWFSYFKTLAGNSELTRDNLTPVLDSFKSGLMAKNVAQEIAEKLCESVLKSLEGKTIGTFTTVKGTVKEAIEQSLTRILTPSRPTDVLQGIVQAQEQKRPYSIVFVGVNGVGKSTSLAKVGAYFISRGFKVGIVACDTFRSGAIEQLRTHATALKVPLFDRGYNRDPASVAAEGIRQAQQDGRDVVLIDTAGRMQDNEPLMRALSKLISFNRPDLVLFVGEALVGNDAVDQLLKFNRCLADLSESSTPRLIDGIVLTKFDTIDDKVGAAISMTYTTGQPIMFVGTGQTYKDLRRMNVKLLIRSLLR